MSDQTDTAAATQIAVIGMAGRFPGSRTLADYWRNLCAGVESVKFFTDEELLAAGESPENLADPSYVRAWPVLEDIELFDAVFFGMSPRDAAVMDPQHRFFLEVGWSALENAGYEPEGGPQSIGVFAANGMNTYMMHHLVTNREVMETVGEWLVRHTGNDMNFLATRLSYQMNLKGPSLNVQTACSSALVAVHLACQSLLNGECDMALAGASAMSLPQNKGYLFKEGEILSRDGHCRPFDAGSRGTLFGSGTGVVVLKRLADAVADGDNVLAVIRGSAINNDGVQKVGYLAPSVEGQARVVAEALAISGTDPETITYVETHGTGTAIGDPIEIAALTEAYRAQTDKRGYCAIGSVKANIGHLGEAAGMAGLIKTVLALGQKKLPPSINYEAPNPEIDFASSPFFVNAQLLDWKSQGAPLRAAVTALGAGGTNAHVILEAPPARPTSGPARRQQLLLLSAKNAATLERATADLAAYLEENPGANLADVAYTLQVGRKHFAHRRVLVADSVAAAAAALRARDPKQLPTQTQSRGKPSVVFMFPGGGAQYASMGQELYQTEPVYKAAFDECLGALAPDVAAKVRGLVFAPKDGLAAASTELERPSLALPALFAAEYATAKLLSAWGVEPAAFIGHSMGEYVAACLSGVFSARDGVHLVTTRGKLFETLPAGGMLSVALPETELRPRLGPALSIAAVNGANLCVASGPVGAIDELERALAQSEVETTRIHISVAAHSTMLEPILNEFEAFCRTIQFKAPRLPFVSNLTGTWIKPEEATDPQYWVKHLRSTVRFADGVARVLEGADRVLVEVGPGRTLSSLARQHTPSPTAVPTMRHPREAASDVAFLLETVGRIWLTGARPDFTLVHGDARRNRVPLPTYSFERQRYWIEAGKPTSGGARTKGAPRKKSELAEWFYTPSWKRAPVPAPVNEDGPWLLFCDEAGLGERLGTRLDGKTVVRVVPGDTFKKIADGRYALRPGARPDYEALFEELAVHESLPRHVVYLWTVTTPRPAWFPAMRPGDARLEDFDGADGFCFVSLLFLAQELGALDRPLTLSAISNGLHQVGADQRSQPEKALLLGPIRVIPREYPLIRTRSIDVALATKSDTELDQVADTLLDELRGAPAETIVALRGPSRWVQGFDALPLAKGAPERVPLREGGVYLITGGLGGIGLELAHHLAVRHKAKLVLVGRTGLPDRAQWPRLVAAGDLVSRRIEKVQAIEAAGGEVLALGGDVTSREQMQDVREAARRRFGRIRGIIHSAGLIDDGLIALKTREAAAKVISGKARGALVLDEVFGREPLDFFAVFSSVSSILGLEGQIDYTAANAFLDAFAQRKSSDGRTQVVSINWSAWQEVGMAVAIAERPGQVAMAQAAPHPCLERIAIDTAKHRVFVTSFSRTKHWLLAEHVVRGGDALIPGTGYLELARAALQQPPRSEPVELRDVTFLAPFAVRVGESRDLRLMLAKAGDSEGEFTFFSHSEREPHVTGRIGHVSKAAPPRADLVEVAARCSVSERVFDGFLDQAFMEFGPRWANVARIRLGRDEALISLALPASFATDLREFQVHPALLDMATGGAQPLIADFDPKQDFFVPFAYGRLTLFRPLPAQVVSHIRYRRGGARELAVFDVTIHDPQGEVLAEIANFTMKRVAQATAFTGKAVTTAQTGRPSASEGREQPTGGRITTALRHGILPAEGMDAFERILASRIGGQVVASSMDLHDWLAQVEADARPPSADSTADTSAGEGFARPTVSAEFLAPRNEVERELAGMWRELLGLKEVGVHDDFFDLGGQSLVAVRLFNKIRKRYGVDLPLSTLFEAPNIEGCAKIIAEDAGIDLVNDAADGKANGAHPDKAKSEPKEARPKRSRWTSLVIMQSKGALPPLFCIAGMGGTLNNLRNLALLTGTSRPFYGLQPPGTDDPSKLLYSVTQLAEFYLREIKAVQPLGPYSLSGYSGGGIAAFEIARMLTAAGEKVAFLGFIDSFAPELPQRSMSERAQIHIDRFSKRGPKYILDTLERRLHHDRYHLGRKITRKLRKAFPQRFRYLQVEDSWLVAQDHYRPPPWEGKATLFRARELSAVSLWTAVKDDEFHGWGRYLVGGVDVQYCPGDHTTMCEEPNVRVLAAQLREALDRVSPEGSELQPSNSGPQSSRGRT